VVVVPDDRGEGEDPVQDADEDAAFGSSAVSFQVKLGLEGLVHGLDDLPQRLEQLLARLGGLALADRAEQREVTARCFPLEVTAEVVLVPGQRLPVCPGRSLTSAASAASMPGRVSRSSAFARRAARTWVVLCAFC
jgi:hypothetical protein